MGGSSDVTEEWATEDDAIFRLLADYSPPRSYGYSDQLRVDLRSWKPLTLWAVATICFVAWAMIGNGSALSLGIAMVSFYLWAIHGTVRYLRDTPTAAGHISQLLPHLWLLDHSTAMAVTAEGLRVPISVKTRLVSPILGRSQHAEVLFLHDNRSEYCAVFGARAMPGSERREEVPIKV